MTWEHKYFSEHSVRIPKWFIERYKGRLERQEDFDHVVGLALEDFIEYLENLDKWHWAPSINAYIRNSDNEEGMEISSLEDR